MSDLIFIAGASGVGKSTLIKELHKQLRSPFFELGWQGLTILELFMHRFNF